MRSRTDEDAFAHGTLDDQSLNQLRAHLALTPAQRLEHLRQLVAFEQQALRARPVG